MSESNHHETLALHLARDARLCCSRGVLCPVALTRDAPPPSSAAAAAVRMFFSTAFERRDASGRPTADFNASLDASLAATGADRAEVAGALVEAACAPVGEAIPLAIVRAPLFSCLSSEWTPAKLLSLAIPIVRLRCPRCSAIGEATHLAVVRNERPAEAQALDGPLFCSSPRGAA